VQDHSQDLLWRDSAPVAGPALQASIALLQGGWVLMAHGTDGLVPGPIILARSQTGVALFELEPSWTPDLVSRFRRQLDVAGFTTAFPGYLPVIHRRLRVDDLPYLAVILDEGFTFQDPIRLPPDDRWRHALQVVLAQPPANPPPPPPPAAPARRRGRVAWPIIVPAMLGLTLAGVATVTLVPRPWTSGPAPAPPPIVVALTEEAPPATRPEATGAPAPGLPDAADAAMASAPEPLPEAVPDATPLPPAQAIDPAPPPEDVVAEQGMPPLAATLPVPAEDTALAPTPLAPERSADMEPLSPPDGTWATGPGSAEPVSAEPVPPPLVVAMPTDTPPVVQAVSAEPLPAPAAIPSVVAATPPDPRATATLLRRGTALLALGDISGARRFLERASESGNADAARLLAETLDPNTLPQFRTRGLQPDPAAALRWYHRAAALGAAVERPIATLEAAP